MLLNVKQGHPYLRLLYFKTSMYPTKSMTIKQPAAG